MFTFQGENFSFQQLSLKSASAMHLWICNISVDIGTFTSIWLLATENIVLPKRAGCLFSAYDSFPLRPSISPQLDAVFKNRFSGLKRFFANFQPLKICNPSITTQLIMSHPKFQGVEFLLTSRLCRLLARVLIVFTCSGWIS